MIRTETEVTIWHIVYCDECGAHGPEAWSSGKANEKAKKQGWLVLENGDHFCPAHKESDKAINSRLEDLQERIERLQRHEQEIQQSLRPPPADEAQT